VFGRKHVDHVAQDPEGCLPRKVCSAVRGTSD
jgi:hypothetical protein